jgi:hypothetical protein|tara:strand:- start:1564 stop:2160 length:597 start_codon:yes stop_codon:yes gene_type:complete
MSNLDIRLDTSRIALTNSIASSIPTASAAELLKYARIAKNLKQTENNTLETLINTRANGLITGSTTDQLVSIAGAVSKVIDALTPNTATGTELPVQSANSNKYLTTNGTNMSWEGIQASDLNDVDVANLTDGETLVYNSTTLKWEGGASTNRVLSSQYANVAAFPSSGNEIGDFAYAVSEQSIHYWNGTSWTRFGTYS